MGIDPGLTGGLASWDGEILLAVQLPCISLPKRRGRELYLEQVMTDWFSIFGNVGAVYIEKVASMPGQGVASTFKFGKVYGILIGMAAAQRHIPHEVMPRVWKAYYNLGPDKKEAVEKAVELFPDREKDFYGPRGGLRDGVAEAALIAKYGYDKEHENGEV